MVFGVEAMKERVKALGALLLLTLALPLALAQTETWTPSIDVKPIRDFAVQVLKWTTYAAVIFVITYAVFKLLYGRALAGSGAPGVASRGYTEKWEAFASLVWFAVALVALPFIIWIVAKVGLLPPWIANEMANVIKEIWYWSPGG
jgi:hypothetical protein